LESIRVQPYHHHQHENELQHEIERQHKNERQHRWQYPQDDERTACCSREEKAEIITIFHFLAKGLVRLQLNPNDEDAGSGFSRSKVKNRNEKINKNNTAKERWTKNRENVSTSAHVLMRHCILLIRRQKTEKKWSKNDPAIVARSVEPGEHPHRPLSILQRSDDQSLVSVNSFKNTTGDSHATARESENGMISKSEQGTTTESALAND
jgi:hypothetical protein